MKHYCWALAHSHIKCDFVDEDGYCKALGKEYCMSLLEALKRSISWN